MPTLLATCIFGWKGLERQTARYGAIILGNLSYLDQTTDLFSINIENLKAYEGRRVRLTAEVVESRPSGHCGDFTLKIKPDPKPIGSVVDLGVGTIRILELIEGCPQIALEPDLPRDSFWINPLRLYELHDQTVNLFVDESTEPAPEPFKEVNPVDNVMYTDPDGFHQVRTKNQNYFVPPSVKIVGDSQNGSFEVIAESPELIPGSFVSLCSEEQFVKYVAKSLRETHDKIVQKDPPRAKPTKTKV